MAVTRYTERLIREGQERRRLTRQLGRLVGEVAEVIADSVPLGTTIRAPWDASTRVRAVERRSNVGSYRTLAIVSADGQGYYLGERLLVAAREPGATFPLHGDLMSQIVVASREDYLAVANHLPEIVQAFEACEIATISALRGAFEKLRRLAEAEAESAAAGGAPAQTGAHET